MPARDLRGFLVALDTEGDLARIRLPVNPNNEIAVIAARAADLAPGQRRALLFDQIGGEGETACPFRVAANLYATHDRMALALNVTSLDDIRSRFARLFDFNFPRGSIGMMTRLADFIDLARSLGMSSGMVRNPPVQDVVHRETVNALLLPAIRISMHETHPSLTALLTVKDANGTAHLRSVRAAVLDSHTLAVRLDPGLSDIWAASDSRPAALVLGADPALAWSAAVPLPEGFDRGLLAAWLRGKAVPLASALSQPLEIPAEAEVVVEGMLTGELAPVEWMDEQGVLRGENLACLHITAMTHRERAIIPIRVPGSRDAYWMRRAAERLFGPILKTVLPDVIDVHHVDETLVIARVSARADQRKMMYGLWGIVENCRRAVLVPPEVDPFDAQAVIDALMNGVEVITADDRFALIAGAGKSSTISYEGNTALADMMAQIVGANWTLYGGRIAIVGIEADAFERIAAEVRVVFPDLVMVGVKGDVNVCDFPFVLTEVIRWGWVYAAPGDSPAVRAFHPAESDEWTPLLTAERWRALEHDILGELT